MRGRAREPYLPRGEDEDREADQDVEEVLRAVAEEERPPLRDLDPVDEHAEQDLHEVQDEERQADFLLARASGLVEEYGSERGGGNGGGGRTWCGSVKCGRPDAVVVLYPSAYAARTSGPTKSPFTSACTRNQLDHSA